MHGLPAGLPQRLLHNLKMLAKTHYLQPISLFFYWIFLTFAPPISLNHRGYFMQIFRKQLNADAQDSTGAEATAVTATTNAPAAAPVVETTEEETKDEDN